MMESTTKDIISLPTSIVQKEAFKSKVKNEIMEGELNPLEFYRRAKLIADCIEDLKKDGEILSCAQEERAKYGKEKPVVSGAIVDTGSKTTYDYKACGDKVWENLKEQIAAREKFLKALPSEGLTITDPDGGETVTIYPPAEKISEFITVKI